MLDFIKALLEGDPWALAAGVGWIFVLGCAVIVLTNSIYT